MNGEGSEDPPKKVNIVVATTDVQYQQLQDNVGSNWHVIRATSAGDAAAQISNYLKENGAELQNLAYIHHGNVWGEKKDGGKITLGSHAFKRLNDLKEDYDAAAGEKGTFDSYVTDTRKEAFDKETIDTYTSLRDVFGSIRKGGLLISVACAEGERDGTGVEISRMANNNINVYTNFNYTHVENHVEQSFNHSRYKSKSVSFGSIMNTSLTGKYKDPNGWEYYNCKTKLATATKKDIMLNSAGGKPFSLVNGNTPSGTYIPRRQFYSKAYRAWIRLNTGEEQYQKWFEEIKSKL